MVPPKLALFLVPALALAFLPNAQAQVLDPPPHDCQWPADYECSWSHCVESCPLGCDDGPGGPGCAESFCGLLVETPVLFLCFHSGFVPMVDCLATAPDVSCTDYLWRE